MSSHSAPLPPSPTHLIRSHSSPICTVNFSKDNERIYSADASGLVVVTSTRSLRAIASWKAHTTALLRVDEWDITVVTHGRDNKLHLWSRVEDVPSASSIRLGDSASVPGILVPELRSSMDVNALNFCAFSLLPLTQFGSEHQTTVQALIALPNLVDSSLADVWLLPSRERVHAGIGRTIISTSEEKYKHGIIMSLHLFMVPSMDSPSTSERNDELRLLCGYENGGVTLWRFTRRDKRTSVEGVGWEVVWTVKQHAEAVMAMAVSTDNALALTVSADHIIGRYDLAQTSPLSVGTTHRTKYPGNSAIAIRGDGKVCAVGGWDGKIRLYSTRTLKPLGTLVYHKSGCQSLVFANLHSLVPGRDDERDDNDDDNDLNEKEKRERSRWLVAGGKDNRVSLWELMSFTKDSL